MSEGQVIFVYYTAFLLRNSTILVPLEAKDREDEIWPLSSYWPKYLCQRHGSVKLGPAPCYKPSIEKQIFHVIDYWNTYIRMNGRPSNCYPSIMQCIVFSLFQKHVNCKLEWSYFRYSTIECCITTLIWIVGDTNWVMNVLSWNTSIMFSIYTRGIRKTLFRYFYHCHIG